MLRSSVASIVFAVWAFAATSIWIPLIVAADAAPRTRSSSDVVSASVLSPLRHRHRSLLCLGIFRDCDEEDDSEEEDGEPEDTTNSTDGDGGGGLLDDIDLCLGIFRDCNKTTDSDQNNSTADTEDEDNSENSNNGTDITGNEEESENQSESNDNCSNVDTGIFGRRPLLGECGILTELISNLFGSFGENSDDNEDGIVGEINLGGSDEGGPFGLGLLPEGGLLWKVWNRDGDDSLIGSLTKSFDQNTQPFTSSFLQDWSETAVTSNDTCVDDVATVPECFDAQGDAGFWVCRTLTNPYTGIADNQNVCIGTGSFLVNNDNCGCCLNESTSTANGTTTAAAPVCPAPCPCQCDLEGNGEEEDGVASGTGVWVTADFGDVFGLDEGSTTTNTRINRCVDSRWAVSVTSRLDQITCLEECPTETA